MQQSTQVLSEALNKLINAYEQLQKENSKLNNKIKELEDEKSSMQKTIDELSSTTTKQTEDIGSMLGKIESLLSVSDANSKDIATKNEPKDELSLIDSFMHEQEVEVVEEDAVKEDSKEDDEISTSKIDLQRMENLLSGFGGNR